MKLLTIAAGVCTLLLISGTSRAAAKDAPLKVGDDAPHFSATTDSGETWNSKDHYGDKTVVVYFYPAAMTGGCTKQACAFRDAKENLADANVEVVGVSGDMPEGLALFKKAEGLNFPLLSDADGEIAKKFGVPTKSGGSIEREVDGESHTLTRGVTTARWTFIIIDGKIALKNTTVKAAGDAEAVLKFLKENGDE